MKISQILNEAPLPDDWDHDMFDDRVPMEKRIEYAKSMAEEIGRGSSRVAFKIPYQGRDTVLKVATLRKKGLHQNEVESVMLDDPMITHYNITIPMIDYDEQNTQPVWIHTEYARPLKIDKQLDYALGLDKYETTAGRLFDYIENERTGNSNKYNQLYHSPIWDRHEIAQTLMDLILNFDLPAMDFSQAANWGIYQNRPVIIDLGFNEETKRLYS